MKKIRVFMTLLLGFVLVVSVFYMPAGDPSYTFTTATETYLSEGTQTTGATNIIAAIITDYRAFDTLGETLVLFTAILAVVTVLKPLKESSDE